MLRNGQRCFSPAPHMVESGQTLQVSQDGRVISLRPLTRRELEALRGGHLFQGFRSPLPDEDALRRWPPGGSPEGRPL